MTVHPILKSRVDQLAIRIYPSNSACGSDAAELAAQSINASIRERQNANIILATGNSQLTFLHTLRELPVDWSGVNIFHMDEYIGLPAGHPASFPHFLRDNLVNHIQPRAFYPIDGSSDANHICSAYSNLLKQFPADLCVMGIGENGHIAFNDPPYADFTDPRQVKIVRLDQRSRLQQVGEGHFPNLVAVPTHAVTLTIPALLSARQILCIVPEQRKAAAVKTALFGAVHPDCPASILRKQQHCTLFLDQDSASEVFDELQSRR